MSGINQIQVNADVGLTFASGLRSILAQDPNVVMVGEIRDKETATLAVQAALTGHLYLVHCIPIQLLVYCRDCWIWVLSLF